MPVAVPILFPVDFDRDAPSPLHFGRLYLGKEQEFCARLFFRPTGELCLAVPEGAVKAGAVVLIAEPPPGAMFGFGAKSE